MIASSFILQLCYQSSTIREHAEELFGKLLSTKGVALTYMFGGIPCRFWPSVTASAKSHPTKSLTSKIHTMANKPCTCHCISALVRPSPPAVNGTGTRAIWQEKDATTWGTTVVAKIKTKARYIAMPFPPRISKERVFISHAGYCGSQ